MINKITAKLKVTKVDSESKLPLLVSNITFKIYDEDHNKCVPIVDCDLTNLNAKYCMD